MFRSIIFDLDGTLIDSRAAILDAFGKALAAQSIEPRIPWAAIRIGPPLTETLRELVGDSDETLLDALAEQFKAHYDTSGYRASEVFGGVQELLDALAAAGARCFLATNKRIAPTRLILSHLQWEQHFRDVYALDRETPRLRDKATMLARLLTAHALAVEDTIYVGDTPEDEAAAAVNGLHFAAVTWGYGKFATTTSPRFTTVPALLDYLSK
jgi:phosphoglycolate phosphatase